MTFYLLILASVILISLSGVAIFYLSKLSALRTQQKAQEEVQAAAQKRQRDHTNKSIQILANAIGGGDITLTEASIRISVLLDSLDVPQSVRSECRGLYELRELTSHIPILQAWKEVGVSEKKLFNKEREVFELKCREQVLVAAIFLKGKSF